MDGQSFDPKFGTEIQPSKVVKPITDRNEFVQKIIQNRTEVKPQSWFKVENLNDDGEDIAEQTGASEFAAGIIRNDYDPQAIKKLEQDEIGPGADETLVTQPYYNPTQDNRWLYGENLGVTRYEALRRAVGLQEGQSFTEFYNVNKFVPQGFELDAKLLLREEKIKALETKMLNGEIGYDTFLYRAYGKDLLKAQGHDFNSSLYWYTRRKQGYFDSVKNNLAFMNEILRSAEQSYVSEAWNRTASTMTLDEIDAVVASEKPLSTVKMKELFPTLFEALSETIDSDRKIHDLFLSGQLGRQFQPFLDTDGDGKIDYYLHLNGRLYSAAEESEASSHQARVKYDEDGKVASVYLPGTFEWDAGAVDAAVASFSKVFWGIPEFLGYLVFAAADLGDYVLGTGLNLWDGQDLGEARYLSSWYTTSNKWANSWGVTSEDFWIADQSLMKNGDISVENAARGVASAVGTVAGMMSLAWVGGFLGKVGAGLSDLSKGTNLTQGFSPQGLRMAGSLAFKGSQVKGFIPKTIYALGSISSRMSMIKNGAPIFFKHNLWGMSAEAAGYLAFRDFFTTTAELAARQELNPTLDNEDILKRSLEMTLVNFGISFAFRAVADQGIVDRFAQTFRRGGALQSVGKKAINKGVEQAYSSFVGRLTGVSGKINALGDMVENWATMAMNMGVSLNQDDYSQGEFVANFLAGSSAMLNNPSALAMQIFQGAQAYWGSALAFRGGYGQQTRNVENAIAMAASTRDEAIRLLTKAAADTQGSTRVAVLNVLKKYNEHRLYEHEYQFDKKGEVISEKAVLDSKGEKVLAKDPESNEVAALLWLNSILLDKKDPASAAADKDASILAGIAGVKKDIQNETIVVRALRKSLLNQKIKEVVVRHQLIFGVYNNYMENKRANYEKWMKNPRALANFFSKPFNIYKKIEVALGRSTSPEGKAAREMLLLQMRRRSDIEVRQELALKEAKLLAENPAYAQAWADASERIVIQTISGKIDFSQLTEAQLRELALKRVDQTEATLDPKGDKGYLIRYILTNLSTEEISKLTELMVADPDGAVGLQGGLKITIKGAGGLDEKKRQEILKVLDVLASWDAILYDETGQKQNIIKLSDGTYLLKGSLENEFNNLNLYDYVGSALRLITALKLDQVTGTNANFKQEALEILMDKFDGQPSGTFKKDLTGTDDKKKLEAQTRVTQLIDNLVEKGVLTYEQAARIYQDNFATPDALANTNSVAYYRKTINKFVDVQNEFNVNRENPTLKFADTQREFIELVENASAPLKEAIFKQLGLTQKDLDNFKQKQYEALRNAKKTLGSLVGLRLPASQDLEDIASLTGSSTESLSDLVRSVLDYIQILRTRRVKGFEFSDDIKNVVLETYIRIINNGLNVSGLSAEKTQVLKEVLLMGLNKSDTIFGFALFERPIVTNNKLVNYLISNGFSVEEINAVQANVREMQVNFVKDSLLAYNDQILVNLNPKLYQETVANMTPAEVREFLFEQYINEEYARATIMMAPEDRIQDTDANRTEKRLDYLLKNDPFFFRNLGDKAVIDTEQINSLENKVKNYTRFVYLDTIDQKTSGKVYVNLNTFTPPMILKAYRALQYKDVDIPQIIATLDGKPQDFFNSLGFTPDQVKQLSIELKAFKIVFLENPTGTYVFDLTSQTDTEKFVGFLKQFGITFSQQKQKLREFGVQGKVPNDMGPGTMKVVEVISEEITFDYLLGELKRKEKEELEKSRSPENIVTSYEARLNNMFSNILYVDDNTVLTPEKVDEILLSAGVLINDANRKILVDSFGALSEAETVKFGKAGGLAKAIQNAYRQAAASINKDPDLSNFKLLIGLSKYLVDWSSSKVQKPIVFLNQGTLMQDFKDTGIWEVEDLGDGKFQLRIVAGINSEEKAFALIAKWINSKKGQAIDFNLLVPNTGRFGGASVITSPLDQDGKLIPGQEQSGGTGDYPFAVLKRNLQSGTNIEAILGNKITFNLTQYELNEDSYSSLLAAAKGKTIGQIKEEFKDTKNPYIRMMINTLSNGVILSEVYLKEVNRGIKAVSEDGQELDEKVVIALMSPTARRIISKVIAENADASPEILTGLINNALRSSPNFNLLRRTSVSSLDQYRLEGDLDYVNQSMLGTFRPQIQKPDQLLFNENDVKFIKDQLEKVYTVSDEENFTTYNKYSNVINALLASNDTDQELTAEQRKSRYGSANGGAVRIDVESLYYMSDEELNALEETIKALNFTAGSKRILGEKLNYLRLTRASKAKTPGDVRLIVTPGAASVTTKDGSLAVKGQDGQLEDQSSLVNQFLKNLQTKATPSNVRDERSRLNNVLGNSKVSDEEQDWALYLDSELRKLNQGSSVGNRLILNLSKNDNLSRYVVGIAGTAAVIEKQLLNPKNNFEGDAASARKMSIEIATKMQILTDGSDFVSMATKYLFVDLKTGKIINTASLIDSSNNEQHLNDFIKAYMKATAGKDISIGVIELNKNMMTGAGSLSKEKFGYYIINDSNVAQFNDILFRNVFYQASLDQELKNADAEEQVLGVLSKTVTQKDFESAVIRSFAAVKQELGLRTNFFDEVGRVLIGTLSDTVYNNNGTYTTEEMWEARELGYEFGLSDEDFQLLTSKRNLKIQDIITYFVNKDSLPLPINQLMGVVKNASEMVSRSIFIEKRLETLKELKESKITISELRSKVREAKNKSKKALNNRLAIFNEAKNNLSNFYEGFDAKVSDIKSTLKLEDEQIKLIYDARQEAYSEPRNALKTYESVLKRASTELKEYFNYIKKPYYNPFVARDLLLRALPELEKRLNEKKASGVEVVKTMEHDVVKNIKAINDLFKREYQMDEFFKKELSLFEAKLNALKEIKGQEKYIEKQQRLIQLRTKLIEEEQKYIDDVILKELYVNKFDSNNEDLIDQYISGRKTSTEISYLIQAEADYIGRTEGEEAKQQFLKDTFEEIAVRYILESENGEAINYRLLKLSNIKDGDDTPVLSSVLKRHKQNDLKDSYIERFLVQEEGSKTQDFETVFFDIEAFFANNYNANKTGKLTSPFSATFMFLNRVEANVLTNILSRFENERLSWSQIKDLLKTELVRTSQRIFIPVYYFDELSQTYKIVNTTNLVRQKFPEYNSKYLAGSSGALSEVNNYIDDIQTKLSKKEIKAELTIEEHKQFKNNYVGRQIKAELQGRKVNLVGYNNKAYDEAKLLDREGDVGFKLIEDESLFKDSFDSYVDLISGLSTRYAGDRRSLDEFRRIYGIDASAAHESEDDVLFTLFITLKEMNRLEDSNVIQSSIIPRLQKLKRTLYGNNKKRFNNDDANFIEEKINERLELANINKESLEQSLTQKELDFFGDYKKIFEQSNDFRSKLIADLIGKREALFKQSQFKKGWKLYSGFLDEVDPKTREFANKITNEKTKLNIGNAISFVVNKLFSNFNEQNLGVSFEQKLNYRIPNSNFSIFDFVSLAFKTLSQNDLSSRSNLDKFRDAILKGSDNPVELINALAKIINANDLTKNVFDLNNIGTEFDSFKRFNPESNVRDLFSQSLKDENVVSMKHDAEREKATSLFFNALEPIVDNFLGDVDDPVLRSQLLKDLSAFIAYDFDQKEIKNRLQKFGFNDVLTNIDRSAAFEVLDSLAASSVGYKALYKGAQALSAAESIKYYQKDTDGKYKLVDAKVDNVSYYISESEFKTMFGYSQKVDLALVIESVRKEYNLLPDQDLYVSILRQPSDKQNTLHSYKVKIVEDKAGRQSTISADALKSNHSGDFDGDKLFIFKPTVTQLWVANKLSKYQHGALNAIGTVFANVLENPNRVIPSKENLIREAIVIQHASQLFAPSLMKNYRQLESIKDVQKQRSKYKELFEIRKRELLNSDPSLAQLDPKLINDIIKQTWLNEHDVSGSFLDKDNIYTTQNQSIDTSKNKEFFALKENEFKLASYLFKSKLGNIDSVTGLYRFSKENQTAVSEIKNSGYGKLFQTTGIHLTKDTLSIIKANPLLFIQNMKNYILNDALLNDVNIDTLFDPSAKTDTSAKDFLIKGLTNLEANIQREDFDAMFQSFLEIYDTVLRSSKDYNNTLFLISTTKDFTKSEEFKKIEAKERRQIEALRDLAFSLGFVDKDFKDTDGNFINSLPELLQRFNDTRILDTSVRFQNENTDIAAKFLLNLTVNQDKNDAIILKNKTGKTEFTNAQKARIIYTKQNIIGGVNLNTDSIYALPNAKRLQIFNPHAVFFDEAFASDGLVKLKEGYEKGKVVTITEPGGIKIRDGVVIPENSKIIYIGDSYSDPSLKENVFRELDRPSYGKDFFAFAFVDDMYSPSDAGFYKVTIPGTNKNKNTLNIFDIKASGLDRTVLETKLNGDFIKGFDEDVFKKASASQPGKFQFYDKDGNLVDSPLQNWEKVEYVVEENNLSLIENTKKWNSNQVVERFFDDPSIINNAGNPEAIMYFGRLGKIFSVKFGKDVTISTMNNKDLYEIQTNMKRLSVHDVDTNNGLRTLRILQAKTMIFNSKRLTAEQKNQELAKFLNYSNLNLIDGANLISALFNRLYNTPEEVTRWEKIVKGNKMYNFIFSEQLNQRLFPKSPTQMASVEKALLTPTKAKPIQVNWVKGNIDIRGDFATLEGDVVLKETFDQTGEQYHVDGLGYFSHQDLMNLMLKAAGKKVSFSNSTINKLAPVVGARNKVGSTYQSRYLPALKSDVFKGDPNNPLDGQYSVKSGVPNEQTRTQVSVYNESAPLVSSPKELSTDMFRNDLYDIDEGFLKKMLGYYGYDANAKENKLNRGELYNDSYYSTLFKSYLATSLIDSKNVDEKMAQLATNYDRFALVFDLEKIQTDEKSKEVRVTLKRSKKTGKMGDFKQTLKEELGSVYYFDLQDQKKEELRNDIDIANLLKKTNLNNVDILDAIDKNKGTPEYFLNFKSWLQQRDVYLNNKALAQKKFKEDYASMLNDDDKITERYLQNNLEKSITEISLGIKESERDIHTVYIDRSKKQSMLVGKNMDEEDIIKLDPLKLTTSGVSEEDPRSFEVSQLVTLLKKEPSQIRGFLMSKINYVKDLVYKYGIEKETNLYIYRLGMAHKWNTLEQKLAKETRPEVRIVLEDQLNEIKNQFKDVKSPQELLALNKDFEQVYGDVANELQDSIMNVYNYQNQVVRDSNEPIQDIYWIMLPTIKTGTNKSTFESIKQLILNPEERLLNKNGHVPYEGYNFFRSIETTVYSLTKHIAAENFSVRAQKAKVLVNLPVVNFLQEKIKQFMNLDTTKEAIKKYDEEGKKQYEYKVFSTLQEQISGTLSEDSDIIIIEKNYRSLNPVELYQILFNNIEDKLAQIGLTESEAAATMKREQFGTLNYNKAKDVLNLHAFRNDIFARITNLIGKDTLTTYLYNELQTYASSKGYALADRYGRKQTGKFEDIRPLSEYSMEWVATAINDNVGYLGGHKNNFITKALSGDIYLIDAKLQDHLHKYFYVTKAPSNFAKITRKLQSLATALIMSNPFKIVDRVLKYSLTDLTFMTIANPKTMFKVPQSRKDLSAFFQSKSGVISKDLAAFFATQGIDPAKTTFDTVLNDFEGVQKKGTMLDNYFEFMGQPFEFQTLLVRYAYWLQTVEDLNNGKENVYGSAYYNKDNVQKIQDTYYETTDVDPDTGLPRIKNTANENKAAYLMAQQLGSPGDFPLLAKDLNGIFMFTTFPLALVRWAKGEAFSMATAVRNLFIEGERKEALSWLATQGGGLLGSALLVQALISLIAGLYNVDEETEKEWQEKQALPDVLATILNGSPVFDIYNTADPVKLFSELTYAPFVEAAQENEQDAIYGRPDDGNLSRGNGLMKWVYQNILGKVNPIFKDPVEVVLGISSLGDSVYLQDGPGYENFVRKMSAYIFGGSGSRALANYIGEISDDKSPDIVQLITGGISRVIQAELGNTKAYKGDVKNYYKVLSRVKSFNYMNQRVSDYSPNTSTNFNSERYGSLKDELRSLFNKKEDFSRIYASILRHLENGGSIQEVRSALNNITLAGQLDKLGDLDKLTEVLSEKEIYELEKAIIYEQSVFPWLSEFRENVRQSVESTYSRGSRYTPRYYQPYRRMYGDSRNIYYRPTYSRFAQNPFNAYRSAWYTINQIGSNKK